MLWHGSPRSSAYEPLGCWSCRCWLRSVKPKRIAPRTLFPAMVWCLQDPRSPLIWPIAGCDVWSLRSRLEAHVPLRRRAERATADRYASSRMIVCVTLPRRKRFGLQSTPDTELLSRPQGPESRANPHATTPCAVPVIPCSTPCTPSNPSIPFSCSTSTSSSSMTCTTTFRLSKKPLTATRSMRGVVAL